MTSPVSALEAIEKTIEGATQGEWILGPFDMVWHADDIEHRDGKWREKVSEPRIIASASKGRLLPSEDRSNAAYIAACNPVAMREVLALARQAEALQRRAEEAEALAERLKLEAQSHAQEARTANSTIYEIYQVVSGGKGEPGNWRGAEPVREKLEALQRENAEKDKLQKVVNAVLTWAEQRCPCDNDQPNPCPLCGASVENLEPCKSAENTIPRHLLADLRRARTLFKGSENAE